MLVTWKWVYPKIETVTNFQQLHLMSAAIPARFLIHHHASVVQGDCFTITGPRALWKLTNCRNKCSCRKIGRKKKRERKLRGRNGWSDSVDKNRCSHIININRTPPSSLATMSSGLPPTFHFVFSDAFTATAAFKVFYLAKALLGTVHFTGVLGLP